MPISSFNLHIHTLVQLTQFGTICSPFIQPLSKGMHLYTTLFPFFSTVVGCGRWTGVCWNGERACVCVGVRALEWASVCVLGTVRYGGGRRIHMRTLLCRDRSCRTMRKKALAILSHPTGWGSVQGNQLAQ